MSETQTRDWSTIRWDACRYVPYFRITRDGPVFGIYDSKNDVRNNESVYDTWDEAAEEAVQWSLEYYERTKSR